MNKYEVTYQEISEAKIILEAKDESDLADLMEQGQFDLDWKVIGFYSEYDLIEIDEEDEDA
jgi:muconolactone delta-isomerase